MIATSCCESFSMRRGVFDVAALALVNRRLYAAINPILYTTFGDRNVISFAIGRGRIETLEVAASFGIDIHYSDDYPLRLACQYGYEHVVNWLLDHGAKIDRSPLPGPLGETVPSATSALETALSCRLESIALLLLSRGATVFIRYHEEIEGDPLAAPFTTALHLAATEGMSRVAEFLVREKGLPVDLQNYEGKSPLRDLITGWHNTNVVMVRKLIELGADVNEEIDGYLPLTLALQGGSFDVALELLDAGSKVEIDNPGDEVPFPIHVCAQNRSVWPEDTKSHNSVFTRIMDAGVDIEKSYVRGHTPLGEAILSGMPNMVSRLIDLGARLDTRDADGDTALDLLISSYTQDPPTNGSYNELQKAAILVRHGARIDTPLNNGYSLLEWAVRERHMLILDSILAAATRKTLRRGYLDEILDRYVMSMPFKVCQVLVHHGAKFEHIEAFPVALRVIFRAKRPSARAVNWFSTVLDMGLSMSDYVRLLTFALEENDKECTDVLLDRGVLAYSRENPSWLPLAAAWGDPAVIRRLLREGEFKVNSLCQEAGFEEWETETPLAIAARYQDHHDAVCALLDHGADPLVPYAGCSCETLDDEASMSAFETALHYGADLHTIKEMWSAIPPRSRPSPMTFISCVPDECVHIVEWLKLQGPCDEEKGGDS
ncbi:hypothetical protein AAE478_001190 [Parahypoxylon ruwenzoriense]